MLTLLFACRDEVDTLAKNLRMKLFRTSVKENFNVDEGDKIRNLPIFEHTPYTFQFLIICAQSFSTKELESRRKSQKSRQI